MKITEKNNKKLGRPLNLKLERTKDEREEIQSDKKSKQRTGK
jgi:hypothetical protein